MKGTATKGSSPPENEASPELQNISGSDGALYGMLLTSGMIGCMVIVCKLLSQLEDADEEKNGIDPNQPLEPLRGQQSADPNSQNDSNQMAPRSAVIRQSWVLGAGTLIII